ncbi:hypothetical protein HanRHA438_Chr01g0023261 [Helianthus annuus]|nr:hypothetical protein HanRHA438_Chr01g0023261 [Helianthus annuus]
MATQASYAIAVLLMMVCRRSFEIVLYIHCKTMASRRSQSSVGLLVSMEEISGLFLM